MSSELLAPESPVTGLPVASSDHLSAQYPGVNNPSAALTNDIPRHQRTVREEDSIWNGEWTDVPPEERNRHQKIAAATRGIVTRANGISLAGGLITTYGIETTASGIEQKSLRRTMLGMGAIVTGRLFDLWDGKDANKNGVKGNFGALEDATIDKINATHALLRFSTKGQINPVLAAINGGMQLANAGAALLQGKKEGGSNASNAGKKATFSLWGSTTVELAATVAGRFGHPKLAKVLTRASRSANIVSLGMNTRATGGYINKFFHIPQRRHC